MPRKKKSSSQRSSSSKKRKSSSKKKSSLSDCAKRRLASQKAIQMANDLCNSKPRRAWPSLGKRKGKHSGSKKRPASQWAKFMGQFQRDNYGEASPQALTEEAAEYWKLMSAKQKADWKPSR